MSAQAVERLVIVGANHRSSALAVRDALFIDDPEIPGILEHLRQQGLTEAAILSTCDRVEIIACGDHPAQVSAVAAALFAGRAHLSADDLAGHLYTLTNAAALRHMMAVASALDSLMIGEPHILGQMKAAHRLSRDGGMCSADLDSLFQGAYASAKRVRSETTIGEGPVSVAACATQVARDIFGDLSRVRLLLAGGGDMGDLIAETFQGHGVKSVTVTARRAARAEQLARTLDAHMLPFDQLTPALSDAEVVVTAIGGRTWAITEEAVRAALKRRRQQPILFVDVGIPGDTEAAINKVDNAFLYDLDDLERLAEKGRAQREKAGQDAWAIVTAEVNAFLQRRAERSAVPTIAALHRLFESERSRALAESHGDAEKATRLLIGRLLHHPSEVMRALAAHDTKQQLAVVETALRQVFALGDADECKGDKGP